MNTQASGTISDSTVTPGETNTLTNTLQGNHEQERFSKSLNLNVRGIGESATLSIQERCRSMQKRGLKVINFGLGQSPFPVPKRVVESLRLYAPKKDYLPVRGLPALREAVASFHRRLDGIAATEDLVLVGPGSKELMFLLQLAFYGELILPSPCWVSYGPQARILGKQIRVIPTCYEERWLLSAQRLEDFLATEEDDSKPRILVLNYPGNPNGLMYSKAELEAIANVSRKWGVIILSDEIYGQIHHRGEHVSIARYYPEGTILSSGLSKWCGAGGWRLGTMTFSPALRWLLEAMAFIASETYTSVSAPIQHAAVHAFQGGIEIERYLHHARRILGGLGNRACSILQGAGIRVHEPDGAFYLFLDFEPLRQRLKDRGIGRSRDLCERLLADVSIAVLPGVVFERPADELTVRMAYVNFNGETALAASETIPLHESLSDSFFESYCSETLEGCRRIADWCCS